MWGLSSKMDSMTRSKRIRQSVLVGLTSAKQTSHGWKTLHPTGHKGAGLSQEEHEFEASLGFTQQQQQQQGMIPALSMLSLFLCHHSIINVVWQTCMGHPHPVGYSVPSGDDWRMGRCSHAVTMPLYTPDLSIPWLWYPWFILHLPPPRPSKTTMCCFRKDGRRNRSLLRTLQWPSTAFRIRTIVLKSYVQDSVHTISLQSYQAPHCPSHGSYLLVPWGWVRLDCSPCLQGTSSRMKVCICSGHHDSCSEDVNIW